jgi:hypothetical protein
MKDWSVRPKDQKRSARARKPPEQSKPDHLPGERPPLPTVDAPDSLSMPANSGPVADMLEQLQQTYGNNYVQRVVGDLRREGEAPHPVEPATKAQMEAAFGESLDNVRIHSGREAAREAEQQGARAYTRGEDITFNAGEHRPDTPAGRSLLAHELAHVIQQRRARESPGAAAPPSSLEIEADAAASHAVANQTVPPLSPGVGLSLQKKDKEQGEEKKEEHSSTHHDREITPAMMTGIISAAGHFTIAFSYTLGDSVVLTLHIPAGVTLTPVPLTELSPGEYRIQDSGGAAARTVAISVSSKVKVLPKLQIVFAKGGVSHTVVFQFVKAAATATPTHHPPQQQGGKGAKQ